MKQLKFNNHPRLQRVADGVHGWREWAIIVTLGVLCGVAAWILSRL